MQGVIKNGNYSNMHEITAEAPLREFHMVEDTVFEGGNFAFGRTYRHGFVRTVTGGNHCGEYVDGVKQDDFEYEIKEPFDKATQILKALEVGGEDAKNAFIAIVDMMQADTTPLMGLQEFIAAYTAIATDNLTFSANLLKKLAISVQGQEWVDGKTNTDIFGAAQSFIRGHTRDQLLGLETELVRAVS